MQGSSFPAKVERLLDIPLFSLHGTPVTPGALLVFVVMVAVAVVMARLARSGTERALSRRSTFDPGTARVAARLGYYLVLAIGLGASLETLGVNLAALFAAGAFLAVAAGLALQTTAQNFVSGVILLVERTIKPGDILEVDGRVVRVVRMGLRATIARTRDEQDLIIPNSMLAQQVVTNFTLSDSTVRVYASVDVSYASDLDVVLRTLRDAAASVPGRLSSPEPRVLLATLRRLRRHLRGLHLGPRSVARPGHAFTAQRSHLARLAEGPSRDPVPAVGCTHERGVGGPSGGGPRLGAEPGLNGAVQPAGGASKATRIGGAPTSWKVADAISTRPPLASIPSRMAVNSRSFVRRRCR